MKTVVTAAVLLLMAAGAFAVSIRSFQEKDFCSIMHIYTLPNRSAARWIKSRITVSPRLYFS